MLVKIISGILIIYYFFPGKITSFEYIKQKQGSTPDSSFLTLRAELQDEKKLQIKFIEHFGYIKDKHQCLADEINLDLFDAKELQIITEVLSSIGDLSATEVSDFSHNIGWKYAKPFEKLGVKHFLATHKPLNFNEVNFFKNLVGA